MFFETLFEISYFSETVKWFFLGNMHDFSCWGIQQRWWSLFYPRNLEGTTYMIIFFAASKEALSSKFDHVSASFFPWLVETRRSFQNLFSLSKSFQDKSTNSSFILLFSLQSNNHLCFLCNKQHKVSVLVKFQSHFVVSNI